MRSAEPFYIKKGNIYAVPITHYTMEMAAQVRLAFLEVEPACVAVELAETMQLQLLHAASRLPDISLVMTQDKEGENMFYMCEPCDAAFEGLRSALENHVPAFCIDLDVDRYPDIRERIPDPYAIQRIGLKNYYETYLQGVKKISTPQDIERELTMARRLKELSLRYDSVLFVGGMAHIQHILSALDKSHFPEVNHVERNVVELTTLSETSCREVMAEWGYLTCQYESARNENTFPPDRQKILLKLFNETAESYTKNTGNPFPKYNLRNLMKFLRNYSLIYDKLMPDLFQILTAAKSCVDHNFAYEVWLLATDYPHLRNVDNLPVLDLKAEEVWGNSKIIRFHPKQASRKAFSKRKKDTTPFRFSPPGPFTICSYPPEDLIIENFGDFLKKKGTQIFTEDAAKVVPFSTSLEDGIDTKETIRHWHEKKLYVKVSGKPPGGVGSIVVVFDEDAPQEGKIYTEQFPWKTTWLGEHSQESDMAFYSTNIAENVVGPGISRCEYGGFMMSYPPRRLMDIWSDPDYEMCRTKPETLLVAAIDYAVKPLVVYVASSPPRGTIKSFAKRFGKKIVYVPLGQLSPITLNKMRSFHVLDGYDKRGIADEYIY